MGPTKTTTESTTSNSTSTSSPTNSNLFEVDTKGICLFCLRQCKGSLINSTKIPPVTSAYTSSEDRERAFHALKVLLRYLNIDVLQQCCNFLPNFLQSVDGLQRDGGLVVKLCSGCLKVCQEFSEVFKEFERIRMQLDRCVQMVYQKMQKGDGNRERVQEYERKLKQGPGWNPLQLFHVNIADNLRRETLRKCSMKVQLLQPRVTISKPYGNYVNYSGYQYGNEGPICVITATQGDLVKEEPFQGLTPMLKVEAAYSPISEGGLTPIHEEILNIIKDDDDPDEDDGRDSTYHPRMNGHSSVSHQSSSASFAASNSLTCKRCNKKFFSKSNAHIHRMTVHAFEFFSPQLPPGTTNSQLRLAIDYWLSQLIRVPNSDPSIQSRYSCSCCSKEYRDRFSVKLHCLENHFTRIVEILQNPEEMSAAEEKTLHPRSYVKKVAVKKTGGKGRRGRRVVGYTGPMHRCPLCRKEFTVLACMKRHYKVFHTKSSKVIGCEICGKKFTSNHNVRTHLNSVHVFESNEDKLPPGTTKIQLVTTLKKMAREQVKVLDPRRKKMGIRCNYCKKVCLDSFFFKSHAVDVHFAEIVERLPEGLEDEQTNLNGESSNQWQEKQEEEFDGVIEHVNDDEEEMPVSNFIVDRMETQEDHQDKDAHQDNHCLNGIGEDSLDEDPLVHPEAVPIVMQVEEEEEDLFSQYQHHRPPPKFRNKFRNNHKNATKASLKNIVEMVGPHEDDDEEMGGISDVPPVLDRYNGPN